MPDAVKTPVSRPVVASYCATFLKPEMLHIYRQVTGLRRYKTFVVTRERAATFRGVPGTAALRPPSRTKVPGLTLAGAWCATGWPATMEGAVRSGQSAAGAVLEQAEPVRPDWQLEKVAL